MKADKVIGEWFHTGSSTSQGDPLSPHVFITHVERIIDKVSTEEQQ